MDASKVLPEVELWKDVKDFEGLYMVSSYGRIRNYPKKTRKTPSILKFNKSNCDYLLVCFFKDGKKYNKLVHRLVAIAFLSNPDNLPEVNHDDGNKANNFLYNLVWSTKSANMQHAYDNGLNSSKGVKNSGCKLTEGQVWDIRDMIALNNCAYSVIAKKFGVSVPTISDIHRGYSWKHLTVRL